MASATLTLIDIADANVVYTLAGSTANGAIYKDATRPLNLPRTLEFEYKLGVPGANGNDKLIIRLSNSELKADGSIGTTRATLEVSVPRNFATTTTRIEDMYSQFASLLTDARAVVLADGLVP